MQFTKIFISSTLCAQQKIYKAVSAIMWQPWSCCITYNKELFIYIVALELARICLLPDRSGEDGETNWVKDALYVDYVHLLLHTHTHTDEKKERDLLIFFFLNNKLEGRIGII